ncbi:hypothetical protein GOBAR_AA25641 [Gossypium barbadense]|uniref:AMP-dependent synthetase/ligase domain-containing protein n=1 Tax=Gossypium barbadense TaxID=3634 RepID=A0A2P5WV96_GOSBA|nr:hypothetical protein GOBAR_AA25641 [Gossypium barbadense]
MAKLTQDLQIRRCSPLLEKASLPSNGAPLSDEWKAVPDIWRSSAEKYGDRVALVDPYHDPPSTLTYNQLEQEILDFTEGLRVIGVKPEEKYALFADNSCRWLVADQGIMATGAINVVRGSRSAVEELLHIYNHSESVGLVIDNPEFFNRLAGKFCSNARMRFIVLLWGEKSRLAKNETLGVPVFSYKEIVKLGREYRAALIDSLDARKGYRYEVIGSDDIATLVYTSGTTGNPKGVMLSHKNLLHQIENLGVLGPAKAGDRFLSMLPTWHTYERACEYFIFTRGIEQVYTTVRTLKVLGSVGHPIPLTEFKVVDSETGEILPLGSKGIIKVRGPPVMKGYYKNPLATRQALDEDGWLNTGDIGWIAPHHSVGRSRRCGGVIVFEGRAKDTIVLSSGENIEPLEIEEAALRSPLIQQIVDQRRLGAIIVPNKDEALLAAKEASIVDADAVDLSKDKITSMLYEELRKWTSECSFQIGPILVVDEPFTIESGLLTPTMKIRRDQVVAQYKEEIANLYK